MSDKRDRIIISGVDVTGDPAGGSPASSRGPAKKFLQVWYRCCHVYGRMMRNAEGTQYIGRCPKCGARVTARIGPNGTSQRLFEAR